MEPILKLDKVCKRFSGFALTDISFSLPTGFIMGLIGHNGAGKTTTINLILDLLQCDSGDIRLFGQSLRGADRLLKEQISVVFDTSCFVEDWTSTEVSQAMGIFYPSWNQETYRSMLDRFSLPEKRKIKELSRGMQTKLMLAAALSHNPRLLILDEPTSGMDPLARDELMDLLLEFVQDGTRSVLFSTHITADLERVADYITFIRQGELFFTGTTSELLESYRIIRGGNDELTPTLRESIIGLRSHSTGFEGLIHSDAAQSIQGLVVDKASIDDIMIFTGKEVRK